MIMSTKQLLMSHQVDPNAFKDVVFTKYDGNNGPCVATVSDPMTLEQAVAWAKQCEEDNKVKAQPEKPAAGTVYSAGANG